MNTELLNKHCVSCNKPVRGRTDKKFCDDNCRNNFNNRLKSVNNNLIRNINHALGKNRRILESILDTDERFIRTTESNLLLCGFHFKYFTHTYLNNKGDTYFFCYDHGYLRIDNDHYLVVKSKTAK